MPSSPKSQPKRRVIAVRIALRLALYLAVTWGTVITLARGAFPGAGVATELLAAYTAIPLVAFALWRGWPFYPKAAFRLFVVRPFWYTQLTLPLVSAGGLLGMLIGLPFGHALLVGRMLAGGILALTITVLIFGYLGARGLVVRHVDVDVAGLAPAFDGLRIGQLSDLHIGPHTSRRFLDRVVATTNALQPDLIAVTGDLVDDRSEDAAVYARRLRLLAAPLGVYMIPGNHDVYAGWDEVERSLRAAKLGTVLVNETHVVRRGADAIALVGTGDPAGGRRGSARAAPDIERALAHVPEHATVIAFAHNPALWPALAKRGVALTLSGHTHWGQLARCRHWGGVSRRRSSSTAMGAYVEDESALYISPGTGYFGIPFRLGARPEVTLVTLHAAATAAARVHPARAA